MSCHVCGAETTPGADTCELHARAGALGDDEVAPTVTRDPLVGHRLGEYVIQRRVGEGGMGLVYEGLQPLINRKVAVKFLRPDGTTPTQMNALLTEARAAAGIRHRGIIDVFGFGTVEGFGQYMVMEYLEGKSLDEVIREKAPMRPMEALPILDETLAALGAAHARGVIHRDLKPSNVFLVQEPTGGHYVKVLDFGLAKQAPAPNASTPQTRASVILGTPEYMAPEQATGQAVGPRTDLYALGTIAFEMLTGRLPFEGATAIEIVVHQVNSNPPRMSELLSDVPPALDDLVASLLMKDVNARPESAEVVRDALKRISRELLAGGTRAVAMPSAKRTGGHTGDLAAAGLLKRRPAVPLVAAGVALALAGAGLLVFRGGAQANTEPSAAKAATSHAPKTVAAPKVPEPAVAHEDPEPEPMALAAQATTGVLKVVVSGGWAEIRVDGEVKGRAPETQLVELPPGPHTLELSNPYRAPYRADVEVRAGQTLLHEARLQPLP